MLVAVVLIAALPPPPPPLLPHGNWLRFIVANWVIELIKGKKVRGNYNQAGQRVAAYKSVKKFQRIEADYLHWQSQGRALHPSRGKIG